MLWLVVPAWRRLAVSRFVLAQHAWLIGELAARGLPANVVVIADDENLDIAAALGLHTLERPNEQLGRKINDGIQYAAEQGATWISFTGSDNWLHPDLFSAIAEADPRRPPIVTGNTIATVDMVGAKLRRLVVRSRCGVPPWLIPIWALQPAKFRPIDDARERGIDGSLERGLRLRPEWISHDPHDLARIDFKTEENITPYAAIARTLGIGQEEPDPWTLLASRYPAPLVEQARQAHLELAA